MGRWLVAAAVAVILGDRLGKRVYALPVPIEPSHKGDVLSEVGTGGATRLLAEDIPCYKDDARDLVRVRQRTVRQLLTFPYTDKFKTLYC